MIGNRHRPLCSANKRLSPAVDVEPRQLIQQIGQSSLRGIPDNIEIDGEIAVSNAIAHAAHLAPGQLGVSVDELRALVHQLSRRFADNDETHDDRLLRTFVCQELIFAEALDEITGISGRLLHVFEVLRKAVLAHMGCASSTT